MSLAFDRLSPALQYQIVNGLGFSELRPVQEVAIPPVLDGKNCVVLAPTAGGKTEAVFFPLLSRMDTEDWRAVSVIYVSPLRALINNQEPRLAQYAGLIGRRAFRWHGDVPTAERRAFVNDPTDILLTTPESLEVMLMSRSVPARRLFRYLQAVVIDEIHAFVGDDRGGHLSAILERLSRYCENDVQRIGLSATVGNPDEIAAWTSGGSKRERLVVDPGGASAAAHVHLDYVANLENATRVIAELYPGTKRLVFADSRRAVESIGRSLRGRGVDAFVIHSSLAFDERRRAEEAFVQGTDCAIIATSALELGIDIGDLDHVFQIDAPRTVAAFLQRMGRTGRRPDTERNCTFLATEDDSLIQAAAIIRLFHRGFVEPIHPIRKAPHILAHQVLALTIQEGGVAESDWWGWISPASAFSKLTAADREELLTHMLSEGILARDGGRLALGPRGEQLYGWRNFLELYSVFTTSEEMTVLWGAEELGKLETNFVTQQDLAQLTFILGARTWRAISVDLEHGVIHVEPVGDARDAQWQGQPALMHRELCEAIRELLTARDEDACWSARARTRLAGARVEHDFLPREGTLLIEDADGFTFWTFAGGRANNLLAKVMESVIGERVTAGNLAIKFRDDAATSHARIAKALRSLHEQRRPSDEDALRFAVSCARARLSKFQPCLSDRLEAVYLADLLTDPEGARQAVATYS